MNGNDEQKQMVLKIIRSLITSQKCPPKVSDIMKEYRETEDESIPYRKFGYKTINDFLKSSGEIRIQNECLYVVQSNASKHISLLVGQQTDKKRKGGRKLHVQRVPRTYTRQPVSAYSNMFATNLIKQSPTKVATGKYMSVRNQNNYVLPKAAVPVVQPKPKEIEPLAPRDIKPLKETNYWPQIQVEVNQSKRTTTSTDNSPPIISRSISYSESNRNQRLVNGNAKSTVQGRLAILSKALSDANLHEPKNREAVNPTPTIELNSKEIIKPEYSVTALIMEARNTSESAMICLKKWCELKKYDSIQNRFIKMNEDGMYQCRITINNKSYSTYPINYKTKFEAEEATAKFVLEQFQQEELANRYPICRESDFELAVMIAECIKHSRSGVFKTKIEERFRNTYSMTLPDNWFPIVVASKLFKIENQPLCIITVNSINDPGDLSAKQEILTDITLPWKDSTWNALITNPVSTVEIWGRLIGPNYSDKFDSVHEEITDDEDLLAKKDYPKSINVGHIYLVRIAECWYRVRVDEENIAEKRYLCFLIDIGDEDWFDINEIYDCKAKYLNLPPQAICFSLVGLEDLAEIQYTKTYLDDLLSNKSLVIEVRTTETDYKIRSDNELCSSSVPKIRCILYDTSTDEDIHLNSVIIERTCSGIPKPELQPIVITAVKISHITDIGEIYCQIQNQDLHYIEKLINDLSKSKFEVFQNKSDGIKIPIKTCLYLALDNTQNKWYRTQFVDFIDSKNVKMLCVDYGKEMIVSSDSIYRIDTLSVALSKYPHQAIRIQLHNIPKITSDVVSRLRGLMPEQSDAKVKIIVPGIIPEVNIFRRINNDMCCLNYMLKAICIEQELESSPEILQEIAEPNFTLNSRSSNKINIGFLPAIGDHFQVYVTMASSPHNFKVRSHKNNNLVHSMMLKLQDYCKNSNEFATSIEEGQNYAGLHSDGYWYRVSVDKIFNSTTIQVTSCDYGDIIIMNNEQLKVLPFEFRELSAQAVNARLYGLKPKNKDWELEDCQRFQSIVVDRNFVSLIKNITVNVIGQPILELLLVDVSDKSQDVYIHEKLIEENRAIKCE